MKEILVPLQAYLLGRSGSTLAGLVLLLSLVWWGGPYVGLQSENLRLAVMAAILVLAVGLWVVRRLLVRRRAGIFRAELQASAGGGREQEIEELRQKMDSAIASLKASGLGVGYRGNSALYALPWFLLIGPAAAGKTTLLRNSGLHFPYAQGDDIDIKGFGGTRNCDWWFADEAVLLDTAGRYTTEENDREEWLAFLGMLRRHRSKAPLNGVMVAVSLVDLLTAEEGGIEWHVKIIRERLDELTRQLGCVFPVYLVVTKADLLKGFTAFFEDLGEHERGQVWGSWLLGERTGTDLAEAFRTRLAELHARLCELRLRKLSMQRNLERKGDIFDFPAQFASAGERLQEFFRLLVKENPYQETPRFSGVYFTSGTQEGTPIQRLVGNMRQAFGYLEKGGNDIKAPSRSFFVKKLFQEVIFPNSRATTRNRRRDLINRWLKGAWVTASLAAIAGSVLLLSTSFTSNALLAHQGRDVVKELENQLLARERNEERVFQAVGLVHDHYSKLLDYRERLPFHLLFGVYEGNAQIEPVRAALLDALDLVFFRPAVTSLEYRLENFGRQWEAADAQGQEKLREGYYQGLKAYLMLTEPEYLVPGFVTPLLTEIWVENQRREGVGKGTDEEQVETMEAMVKLYLSHLGRPAGDPQGMPAAVGREALVAAARKHMRALPDAQRLYAQLRTRHFVGVEDRRLEDLVKGETGGILTSTGKVPGIYTARAWREVISREIRNAAMAASRGDWVLGFHGDAEEAAEQEAAGAAEGSVDPELVAKLEKEIRRLYFADYAEAWFAFLEGVRMTPFTSVQDTSSKLQLLARSDGPLCELMRAVAANINPEEPGGELSSGVAAGRVPELESVFADLRNLANPADNMTVSLLLNQYLLSVSSVQNEMERLAAAADISRESSRYAARVLGGSGGDLELYRGWVSTGSLLNSLEPRTRRIAANLMTGTVRHAWGTILREATRDLEQQWKSAVVATYARKLRGKFPFVDSANDAALADVADFFRPQDGVFWSFVRNNLSPFLTENRGEWRPKSWLDMGPAFSREMLETITRSQMITASLFRRGSDEPSIEFYLYPLPARGVSETLFVTNGQEFRYRNEPQEWRKFRWPGDTEKLGATVGGVVGRSVSRGELSRDGIWGIFHLLRQATVTQESGIEYLSVWELEGNTGLPVTVQFRIKADRENNLFDRRVLTGFDVPENLF